MRRKAVLHLSFYLFYSSFFFPRRAFLTRCPQPMALIILMTPFNCLFCLPAGRNETQPQETPHLRAVRLIRSSKLRSIITCTMYTQPPSYLLHTATLLPPASNTTLCKYNARLALSPSSLSQTGLHRARPKQEGAAGLEKPAIPSHQNRTRVLWHKAPRGPLAPGLASFSPSASLLCLTGGPFLLLFSSCKSTPLGNLQPPRLKKKHAGS